MSRVGKLPVDIPKGVQCELKGSTFKVTGPKGSLEETFSPNMIIDIQDAVIQVSRPDDSKENRSLHGLTRALIANMVTGVTKGFEKTLLIEGVGYRASKQGENLNLALGHSHPVSVSPPASISFEVEGQQTIKVVGISKALVGQVAADIRAIRKPEPYKGKGVRYADEHIRRKVSKANI